MTQAGFRAASSEILPAAIKTIFAISKNDMPPIDGGGSSDIGGRHVPHNDSVNSIPSSDDGGFDDAGSRPTRPGIPGFLEPGGPDLLF